MPEGLRVAPPSMVVDEAPGRTFAAATDSGTDEAAEIVARVYDGEMVRFSLGHEQGTERFLIINPTEQRGNIYRSMDSATGYGIRTADGVEAYGWDYGAQSSYTFSDGVTKRTRIHPMDADEMDVSGQITSAEHDVLERTQVISYRVGHLDQVRVEDGDSDQDVIRVVVTLAAAARSGTLEWPGQGRPHHVPESYLDG